MTQGYFGEFGGRFVPETLIPALDQLAGQYKAAKKDKAFRAEFKRLLAEYAGRPTPLTFVRRLTEKLGGGRIYLKREDLNHTGSHKINNCLGQALLAVRMGKRRIIAETGAGQHGVATATVAALMGLECEVYMGTEDMRRQALNVYRMRLLGTKVSGVNSGSRTLKDATNEAMRDWMSSVDHTHYIIGSVVGPHPFPLMVRDFQSAIGREARRQVLRAEGRLPTAVVACVGGGSNAMGIFHAFRNDTSVKLIGVEAGGLGLSTHLHAAPLAKGAPGVLHGSYSYVLQTADGQTMPVHSVSAGLDYPGVGPEHSFLKDSGRAEYASVTDREAIRAYETLSRLEGIIPALESSHAVAHVMKIAKNYSADDVLIVNLSGRGDKDTNEVERLVQEAEAKRKDKGK